MKKITLLAAFFVATLTASAQLLTQNFDDFTALDGLGYTFVNASDSPNLEWTQGAGTTTFPGQAGGDTSYTSVNFNSTSGSEISDFMILPSLNLKNGDEIVFWTRTITASAFPDRLEVRISPDGTDTEPSGPTDVGSYTELLLSINPDLTTGGYPDAWTQFTVVVTGLTGSVDTKVAFRYFVTDGGPVGNNSNYIGVDTLSVNTVLGVADQSFSNFNYFVNANGLNLSANEAMTSIAIYNLLGQQVASQKLSNNNEIVKLDTLTTGVYLATVTINGASKTVKFVKN